METVEDVLKAEKKVKYTGEKVDDAKGEGFSEEGLLMT